MGELVLKMKKILYVVIAVSLFGCGVSAERAETLQKLETKNLVNSVDVVYDFAQVNEYRTLKYIGTVRGYDLYLLPMGNATVSYMFPVDNKEIISNDNDLPNQDEKILMLEKEKKIAILEAEIRRIRK